LKYKLINYIVCPICQTYPLKLNILNIKHLERDVTIQPCDKYCEYHKNYIANMEESPDCKECLKYEIIDGYLICPKCKEWYPIVDAIVIMLLGDLRPKKVIEKFITKYRDKLPRDIVNKWEERGW
jgi:uncharacterized protein YbaR (Trm112 family)